jgi:hypothetical protein
MLESLGDPKANWRAPADLHIRCHTILHRLITLNHLDIQLDQCRLLQIPLPTGNSVLFLHQRIHRGHRQVLERQHHNLYRRTQVVSTLAESLRPNSNPPILPTPIFEPVQGLLLSCQYIISKKKKKRKCLCHRKLLHDLFEIISCHLCEGDEV